MSEPVNVTLPASDWRELAKAARSIQTSITQRFAKLVDEHLIGTADITIRGQFENFRAVVAELKRAKVFSHVWAPLDTRLNQIENAVLPEDMANAKLAAERMDADENWRSFELEHALPDVEEIRRLF